MSETAHSVGKRVEDLQRLVERANPFDLPPEPYPLWVGLSGGRSSGYQLWRYLERHGRDVINGPRVGVGFANTGEEDEASLRFVDRIARAWGVAVAWIEYRFEPFPDSLLGDREFRSLRRRQFADRSDKSLREEVAARMESAGFPDRAASVRAGRECLNGRDSYAVVTFETASRNREPFHAMLAAREEYRRSVKGLPGVLPNTANNGMCTGQLKVNPVARYVADRFGVGKTGYACALALRAGDGDEERVGAIRGRETDGGIPVFPLWESGIDAADVRAFWRSQPFDLEIPGYRGNCRLCHQKPQNVLHYLIHRDPADSAWREGWEARTGDRFDRSGKSYRRLRQQLPLFTDFADSGVGVVTCHTGWCGD